jgi:hypothetical protein
LSFIKEKENDRMETSKEIVAKFMNEKEICSRPTTLKIIDSLLQADILKDRGGRRNSSDLIVNKEFKYEEFMDTSFKERLKELQKSISPFKDLIENGTIKTKVTKNTKGQHQVLIDLD